MVKYRELYLKAKEELDKKDQITLQLDEPFDLACDHDWRHELSKETGIVYCLWKCKACKGTISQCIGEALSPYKLSREEMTRLIKAKSIEI